MVKFSKPAYCMFAACLVSILVLPGLIPDARAYIVLSDMWSEAYGQTADYYHTTGPLNISTTKSVSSADGTCQMEVRLVTSIYQYSGYVNEYAVWFRTTVYIKNFAAPGYQFDPASHVCINFEKEGSNFGNSYSTLETNGQGINGYSQGYTLCQGGGSIDSFFDDRAYWSLSALAFAVGLACEPVGIAIGLIDLGLSYNPGSSYANMPREGATGWSYWYNTGYFTGRQYCFNTFGWKQDTVTPQTFYGLKITAYVTPWNTAKIAPFETAPVRLRITQSQGGGCPYVCTWNGDRYVADNNLLPASETSSGTDVTDYYRIQQTLVPFYQGTRYSLYSMKIKEFESEHDYLDQAALFAVDHSSGTNVGVSPLGEILTYGDPTPPISAVDEHGTDVLPLLSQADGEYYQGHNGSYFVVYFDPQIDVSNGLKLVIRSDEKPPVLKCPVYVQVLGAAGEWATVAVFHTRTYWATDAINMSACLPDPEGDLKVRLCFISTDKIDFLGLDATTQASVEARKANLVTAIHSNGGNVKPLLLENDQQYAELYPGEQLTLVFSLPRCQKERRSFILFMEGHYARIS